MGCCVYIAAVKISYTFIQCCTITDTQVTLIQNNLTVQILSDCNPHTIYSVRLYAITHPLQLYLSYAAHNQPLSATFRAPLHPSCRTESYYVCINMMTTLEQICSSSPTVDMTDPLPLQFTDFASFWIISLTLDRYLDPFSLKTYIYKNT